MIKLYQQQRTLILAGIFVLLWFGVFYFINSSEIDPKIKDKWELPLQFFVATTTIFITLLEINRAITIQKASFVKDYISNFHTNLELQKTFYELVYCYIDKYFETIHKDRNFDLDELANHRNTFYELDTINKDRPEGQRLYHIKTFQFSQEERKLDSLLNYLDVIGYYYYKNLINIKDVIGTVGFILETVKQRKATWEYIKFARNSLSVSDYGKNGAIPPFYFLYLLLEETEIFNKQRKIKKVTL